MSKRKYTNLRVLLPEIKEMIAEGKSHREIGEHFGLTGVLTKTQIPTVKTKTMWPGSHRIIVYAIAQEAGNAVGDRAKDSGSQTIVGQARAADRAVQNYVGWLSTDSRYSKAAKAMCTYQRRNFGTEKEFRNRWTENIPDENVWPPTARVSAEAREENQRDARDVCEFSR